MPEHISIVSAKAEESLPPFLPVGSSQRQQTVTVDLTLFTGFDASVLALAWSPGGDFLAVASGTRVRVWGVSPSGFPIFIFSEHTATVRAVAWSPDGSLCVASGGDDRTLWVWEFELARRTYRWFPGHREAHSSAQGFGVAHEIHALAWSPTGRYLLAGGEPVLRVFTRSGETQRLFQAAHQTPVRAVAWSPDGQLVASAGYDNAIYIWQAASGALLFPYLVPYTEVTHLAWSPTGDRLAAAYADGPVQVWNPRTPQTAVRYTGHTSRVQALAWSPSGRLVLSGDSEGHMHAWEARTGRMALQYVAQPISAPQVLALAWSSDGKYIAMGTANNTMQLVRIPHRLVELVRP